MLYCIINTIVLYCIVLYICGSLGIKQTSSIYSLTRVTRAQTHRTTSADPFCQIFWNGYKMADQVTDTPNWGEKHQVFTLWISYTKPRPGVICKWINGCYLSLHTDALQCLPLSYISLNLSPMQLTSWLKVCLLWGPEIYIQGLDWETNVLSPLAGSWKQLKPSADSRGC